MGLPRSRPSARHSPACRLCDQGDRYARREQLRKLSELASALEDDYEVSFELITTGYLTEAAKHDLEAFQQELAKLSEGEVFNATIHVIDDEELRRRYDYALESDNPSISYKLNL